MEIKISKEEIKYSMDTEESATLFRIFKTSLKMLIDRGYVVKTEELEMTLEEFMSKGRK